MLSFEKRLATRARDKQPSPIRELLKYAAMDDMISFGGGYPSPDTFVFEKVSLSFKSAGVSAGLMGDRLLGASQYGPSRIDPSFEPLLRDWHAAKGGPVLGPGRLCVLNGSQEGLFILAYLLIDEGDCVVVSEPTYPGAIAAFSSFRASYIEIPVDGHGMDTEILSRLLAEREAAGKAAPKFLYTMPNGHNPGGVRLSQARKRHILELAEKYDFLVVEDDPYELLWFDEKPGESLQSLDGNGRVIRLDSFSKIFIPGFRVGYASGDPRVMRWFELYKQSANLHTSTFNQRILAAYLEAAGTKGFFEHIDRSRAIYRKNRDAMVDSAGRRLSPEIEFNVPGGGLFIWFRFPGNVDCDVLHARFTEKYRVLLVPGSAFSTGTGCRNCMRASFSTLDPERIDQGMRRFALMAEEAGKL